MTRLIFAILLAISSLTAFAAPPNILFILSDDHSYPFIHCYGREEMKTPNLDRFAAEGILCRRMFTGAPQCVPSRATIMTGRSPVAARITRFSSPLSREEITFPKSYGGMPVTLLAAVGAPIISMVRAKPQMRPRRCLKSTTCSPSKSASTTWMPRAKRTCPRR